MSFKSHSKDFDFESFKLEEEERLIQILAEKHNLDYVNLSTTAIRTEALKILAKEEAENGEVIIFKKIENNLAVAITSPNRENTKYVLRKLEELGYNLKIYLISTKSFILGLEEYRNISLTVKTKSGVIDTQEGSAKDFFIKEKNIDDVKLKMKEIMLESDFKSISVFLEFITVASNYLNSSDIHIEHEEKISRIRFRLDGLLVEMVEIEKNIALKIVTRIKLISGMKLNVFEKIQDGRFSVIIPNKKLEIRVSMIPGNFGESCVMRLLDPDSIDVELEDLGIEKKLLAEIKSQIKKPNGLILNTGPTGSGKTTTLYAVLKKIYNPSKKIITIENPIEYHINGIVQTQINSNKSYGFAEGLKASLRQDPDILMVGEIRDTETAKTALNASLTGHLVLSTIHTNTASGVFQRLKDLEIEMKTMTSAINLILAQRLVRKLCPHCKKEVDIDADYSGIFYQNISSIEDINDYTNNFSKMWVAIGCEKCNFGYKGRIGIYDAVIIDKNNELKFIDNLSTIEIDKFAKSGKDFLDIKQDAIIKILKGEISLEEVLRVIEL